MVGCLCRKQDGETKMIIYSHLTHFSNRRMACYDDGICEIFP